MNRVSAVLASSTVSPLASGQDESGGVMPFGQLSDLLVPLLLLVLGVLSLRAGGGT